MGYQSMKCKEIFSFDDRKLNNFIFDYLNNENNKIEVKGNLINSFDQCKFIRLKCYEKKDKLPLYSDYASLNKIHPKITSRILLNSTTATEDRMSTLKTKASKVEHLYLENVSLENFSFSSLRSLIIATNTEDLHFKDNLAPNLETVVIHGKEGLKVLSSFRPERLSYLEVDGISPDELVNELGNLFIDTLIFNQFEDDDRLNKLRQYAVSLKLKVEISELPIKKQTQITGRQLYSLRPLPRSNSPLKFREVYENTRKHKQFSVEQLNGKWSFNVDVLGRTHEFSLMTYH